MAFSDTIATDLDGNGGTDQSHGDVLVFNADGSNTETISDLTATGALKDKTVKTANGLSLTTKMGRQRRRYV